jgi:acetyl CoA:N6-hydroxylysine acetyl transferase
MLVGSDTHRGPHRVRAWLPSLCQYIFLDDPRTDRIVSEPDHRNGKMIAYLESVGFTKVKEFDFPHKVRSLSYIFFRVEKR